MVGIQQATNRSPLRRPVIYPGRYAFNVVLEFSISVNHAFRLLALAVPSNLLEKRSNYGIWPCEMQPPQSILHGEVALQDRKFKKFADN
jgi:hypothetical protein